jgi:lipopolysaccharide transport system permease protein
VSNAGIIKKVYFPREIIPISVVLSNTIMFLITCIIIVIFLFGTGVGVSWYILFFPVILFLEVFLLLGFSFILSAITVYAQDVQHIVSVILMAAFYGTPIVYDASAIPAQYKFILYLNPMTPIVTAYRDILFYQQMPNWTELGYLFLFCIALFYIGLAVFRKLQKGFAEEI